MAYLEFAPAGGAFIAQPQAAQAAGFTALEWTVVDLARRDRLSSIREPGPLAKAARWLFGLSAETRLSDARLETLRRMAVLTWRYGFSVASSEVRDFLSAGFSLDQYEALVARVGARRAALSRRPQR